SGQPLAPAIPQFDTMSSTRTLTSVEVQVGLTADASVSGSVTNGSGTAATYESNVTNASISITGTGFPNPLTATWVGLLDTGPITCPANSTTIIGAFAVSLTNSGDITLTNPADLAAFIGSGNLSYTTSASAASTNIVTGGTQLSNSTTVTVTGTVT